MLSRDAFRKLSKEQPLAALLLSTLYYIFFRYEFT